MIIRLLGAPSSDHSRKCRYSAPSGDHHKTNGASLEGLCSLWARFFRSGIDTIRTPVIDIGLTHNVVLISASWLTEFSRNSQKFRQSLWIPQAMV